MSTVISFFNHLESMFQLPSNQYQENNVIEITLKSLIKNEDTSHMES